MKKIVLVFVIIFLVITSVRCQHFFRYEPIKYFKTDITGSYTELKAKTLKQAMSMALGLTTNSLSFNIHSTNNSDVDYLLKSKKAHCIGYANVYNAYLKSILKNSNISGCKIYRVRAKVYFMGINLTGVSNDRNFKDHDVSMVEDTRTGYTYTIDPSLSEVFGNVIIKQ